MANRLQQGHRAHAMRRLVIHVGVALAIAGLYVLPVGPANADTECKVTDPETGECLITVEVPGTQGKPRDGDDNGPVNGSADGSGGDKKGAATSLLSGGMQYSAVFAGLMGMVMFQLL